MVVEGADKKNAAKGGLTRRSQLPVTHRERELKGDKGLCEDARERRRTGARLFVGVTCTATIAAHGCLVLAPPLPRRNRSIHSR